ncbi:glyoxalase/bleomycin resistance/extradiol dioxygenase family protein, partial [Enterobacter hormaechei]
GSKAKVDSMAEQARSGGTLLSAPRMTGDGFYEAVIADPDGNRIELVGESTG